MNLVFTRSKKKLEVPISGDSEVKLYAVPAAYSGDGYALAVWGPGELEPVPACDQASAELLAHVGATRQEDGAFSLREIFCKQGVTYAQN